MMKDWESKVSQLEREKEELSTTLHDTRTNANAGKVSEQRRKRLQELEQEMSTLKRKMQEQAKALKLKEHSDKHVSHLNTEIVVRTIFLLYLWFCCFFFSISCYGTDV
jgi:kinesin family protein 4/21/27